LVEYVPAASQASGITKTSPSKKNNESYKDIMSESDWPLFEFLREWRGETCKKEGVPPYILCTNLQLAKIAVTRPASLNALQGIKGIGKAKREKYGADILKIVELFEQQETADRGDGDNG